MSRPLALALAALAGAAVFGTPAHAGPCDRSPAVRDVCEHATDPVPDRCYYYPDYQVIRCYWD